MPENWQEGGFALYVHWPFCQAKCPYCDFNSHVRREIDQDLWLAAYLGELERSAVETRQCRLRSIFFGGGTPSLMEPHVVAAVIDRATRLWRVANDLEITLEANPASSDAARFAGYRTAGVNRLSLGIQALNDADLWQLGRLHTAAEAMAAFDLARSTFCRVSCDLIYARPGQSLNAWEAELRTMLGHAPGHLSLYQLTIEPETAYGRLHRSGRLTGLPTDSLAAGMYRLTNALCEDGGLPAYEVSNHARPGCESRHNLVYWRMGDYVGIGPGAHGRLTVNGTRLATETERNPEKWLSAARAGNGESGRETIPPEAQALEYLLMGLRLSEGISLARHARLAGKPLDPARLDWMCLEGLLTIEGDRLHATPRGREVLDRLILELS